MPEVMQLIESMDAAVADIHKLYGSEGRRLSESRHRKHPRYLENLAVVTKFMADIYAGNKKAWQFQEAMNVDDFQFLFADVLDRQMLASYREWPQTFRQIMRISTVRDFRTVKRFAVDGSEAVLAVVPTQTEYPHSTLSDVQYTFAVQKYGRRIAIDWETLINDDLGAFRDIPARFGKSARRSEEKFATGLYVDANGPHASLYTVGNANIVTSNPVLSTAALQTAFTVLHAQTDADGEPIFFDSTFLVVPPALEVTAQNILNAISIDVVEAGGTSNQTVRAQNWMRGRVQLIVNPYIPVIASSANGNTSWWLFGSPSIGRPALEMGFLAGHTEPEIFIKDPNARRVGGGTTDPLNGSFENDTTDWKIRHVFGGGRQDPKSTVASNGSGS